MPINDANSVALHLVNQAGPNGAVVLGFTPPEALSILQAAQLGLEDRVKEARDYDPPPDQLECVVGRCPHHALLQVE
ncbi:MAG: hypothetical protein JO243_02210 [Solirubrobacterales bacterium]|nr:hypothetical protein [Solirubrobacterales bacterium]